MTTRRTRPTPRLSKSLETPSASRPDDLLPAGRYRLAMGLLVGTAALARIAMLAEFVAVHPFAEVPAMDALEYWNIAGRCAAGHWSQPTPFLSAPLYPYFLGAIRTLGADLVGVAVVQLIMHLLTAVVVGEAARAAWGRSAGLVAAAAFLLLTEPAVMFTRLFSENLQLLLVALLAWQWMMLARRREPEWGGVAACGVLLGLLALTYPPALALIPAWAAWRILATGPRRRAVGQAVGGACLAALTISPATLHNWLLHGEPILITAHSGITLRQGNGPEARGIIHSIPGVVARRDTMHHDAAAVFLEAHGREGTWRDIDRHFRDEVLRHWISHPLATVRLAGRKAWLFLTARHYGDMLAITIEREIGMCRLALLAPVAVPWLMGAALVGLVLVLRDPGRFAPFWLLPWLPFLIVTIFFYTPRYRCAAIPPLCCLAAGAVVHLGTWRPARRWPAVAACALPALGLAINGSTGIDDPGAERDHVVASFSGFQMAAAGRRVEGGRYAAAEDRLESALRLKADNLAALEMLVRLSKLTDQPARAIEPLRRIASLVPDAVGVRKSLYNVLCQTGDFPAAKTALGDVLTLEPDDVETQLALAWLEAASADNRVRDGKAALGRARRLMEQSQEPSIEMWAALAAALAECGRFDEAAEAARSGAALAGQTGQAGQDSMTAMLEAAVSAFAREQPLRAMPMPLY